MVAEVVVTKAANAEVAEVATVKDSHGAKAEEGRPVEVDLTRLNHAAVILRAVVLLK